MSKESSALRDRVPERSDSTMNLGFAWTGHPFTDAGLAAILLLSGKKRPEDLRVEDINQAIEFASRLYAKQDWSSGYIHAMILPNSGILMANPSMKEKRTSENIKSNLLSLLSKEENPNAPICEICGKYHSTDNPVYRSSFPLLGTGGVPNYFPSGQDGANICTHCLFLAQMMPLVAYRLKKILIIHAYPYELMLDFHREALLDIKKSELASNARGFEKPENFLFRKIMEIGTKIGLGSLENASITLYYFINNNQEQSLDIIYIPNSVLRFIAFASNVDGGGWRRVVAMGWRKKPDETKFEKFERQYSNEVYLKLLSGESILTYFVDKKNRKTNTKWELLQFYCSEVLGLNAESLEFVKDIADKVVETIEKLPDSKLSKRVYELERAEKLYQFESFFIRIERDRQEANVVDPLMSFEDFGRILTSYGDDINISWKTVKNLILFRIYEKLHNKLIKIKSKEGYEDDTNGGDD